MDGFCLGGREKKWQCWVFKPMLRERVRALNLRLLHSNNLLTLSFLEVYQSHSSCFFISPSLSENIMMQFKQTCSFANTIAYQLVKRHLILILKRIKRKLMWVEEHKLLIDRKAPMWTNIRVRSAHEYLCTVWRSLESSRRLAILLPKKFQKLI